MSGGGDIPCGRTVASPSADNAAVCIQHGGHSQDLFGLGQTADPFDTRITTVVSSCVA